MRRKRSGDALRWSCQSSHSSRAGEGPVTLGPMGSWTTRLVGSKGPFFFWFLFGLFRWIDHPNITRGFWEIGTTRFHSGSPKAVPSTPIWVRVTYTWYVGFIQERGMPPKFVVISMGTYMIWYDMICEGLFGDTLFFGTKPCIFEAASISRRLRQCGWWIFSALRASQLQKRLQRHITTAIGQLRYCYDVVPQKKINHCLADAELHLRIRSVKRPFDECRCLWSGNWPAWTFCKLWLCVGAECLQGIQAAKHREKGTPKARFCQISKQRDSWTIDNDQIWTCIRNSVVLIIFIHNNY